MTTERDPATLDAGPHLDAETRLCERCHAAPASGILGRGHLGPSPLCIGCRETGMMARMAKRLDEIERCR